MKNKPKSIKKNSCNIIEILPGFRRAILAHQMLWVHDSFQGLYAGEVAMIIKEFYWNMKHFQTALEYSQWEDWKEVWRN